VALDELPLVGVFVEIEGPDSRTILRVQELLGLSHVAHTKDSYGQSDRSGAIRLGARAAGVYLEEK